MAPAFSALAHAACKDAIILIKSECCIGAPESAEKNFFSEGIVTYPKNGNKVNIFQKGAKSFEDDGTCAIILCLKTNANVA